MGRLGVESVDLERAQQADDRVGEDPYQAAKHPSKACAFLQCLRLLGLAPRPGIEPGTHGLTLLRQLFARRVFVFV